MEIFSNSRVCYDMPNNSANKSATTRKEAEKDSICLSNRLKAHRNELFTFLDYDDISPYNNHAEQQMHKPVLWRRRCQLDRSDNGVAAQVVLMTIFRTAELQGLNPINQVESLPKLQILENYITDRKTKKAA